jgi:hypothetical protein
MWHQRFQPLVKSPQLPKPHIQQSNKNSSQNNLRDYNNKHKQLRLSRATITATITATAAVRVIVPAGPSELAPCSSC